MPERHAASSKRATWKRRCAASAIWDDRLQRHTAGVVVPDSFTHGSSEQRVRWFRRGFETGDVSRSNTFQTTDQ
jgi:predicted metalloprotease